MPDDVNVPLLPINQGQAKPDVAGSNTGAGKTEESKPQSDKPEGTATPATSITNEIRIFAVTVVVMFVGAVYVIIRHQKVIIVGSNTVANSFPYYDHEIDQ